MLTMSPTTTELESFGRVPPIHLDAKFASHSMHNPYLLHEPFAYHKICELSTTTTTTATIPTTTTINNNTNDSHNSKNVSVNVCKEAKKPAKRGRKSSIPPELREQTRRIKKQNMERRRRACISDKMNALHNLAMNLIGLNPEEGQKVEKADILSMCYDVFKGVVSIANEKPEFKERLSHLRDKLMDLKTSKSSPHHSTNFHISDHSAFTNPSATTSGSVISMDSVYDETSQSSLDTQFSSHPCPPSKLLTPIRSSAVYAFPPDQDSRPVNMITHENLITKQQKHAFQSQPLPSSSPFMCNSDEKENVNENAFYIPHRNQEQTRYESKTNAHQHQYHHYSTPLQEYTHKTPSSRRIDEDSGYLSQSKLDSSDIVSGKIRETEFRLNESNDSAMLDLSGVRNQDRTPFKYPKGFLHSTKAHDNYNSSSSSDNIVPKSQLRLSNQIKEQTVRDSSAQVPMWRPYL